jgi:hypothetical protein
LNTICLLRQIVGVRKLLASIISSNTRACYGGYQSAVQTLEARRRHSRKIATPFRLLIEVRLKSLSIQKWPFTTFG